MSSNSVERYIDLIKISTSMTNEVEKNKIINEAHQVLRNSKPNTGYIDTRAHFRVEGITPCCSNNSYNGLTSSHANPNALPRDQSTITFNSVHGNYSLSNTIMINNVFTNMGYKC